tara:strand:- start:122 stop:499 length:378 start_codon:yes stop_codon:yes gene_type:complete
MTGDFVRFSDIIFEPKPVQKPHPPIFIGGVRALPRFAGSSTMVMAGSRPDAIRATGWTRGSAIGRMWKDSTSPPKSADEIAGDIEYFRDLGGSLLIFRVIGPTVEDTVERMEQHADELPPLVRDM